MRFRDYHQLPDGLPCGSLNKITDVAGLTVGHHTVIEDEPHILRTGVSVLRIEDVLARPVAAEYAVLNAFGKSIGLIQVEEVGTMQSPVFFANTLSTGTVDDGAVRLAIKEKPGLRSYNPVILECNDSELSDIAAMAVTPEMAEIAYEDAVEDFPVGSVGAGAGMVCYSFKGGIGSSSRVIEVENKKYTVGAMVLSNYGTRNDLRIPGLDRSFAVEPREEESQKGSLIMVVATDLPLLPHQLKRVARHAPMAIGLLGSPGGHGSGDIALAFSTTYREGGEGVLQTREVVSEHGPTMTLVFRAAVWATAEAILDSLYASPTVKGLRKTVPSIRTVLDS